MRIFLIRHGESYSNISKFLKEDDFDYGLTKKGKKQALELKKKLNVNNNILIYTSPYKRAIETTKIIFPDKEFKIIDNFKELNKGFSKSKFKNLTWEDWNIFFLKNEKKISNVNFKYPYGESINLLKKRVIPTFKNIIKLNNNGDDIYIITHNWVIKVIIGYILKVNIGYSNLKIKNTSVIEIVYKNGKFSMIL